jgi:hypothetical protein
VVQLGNDAVEIARGHASLGDPESRGAFVHTLRASHLVSGSRFELFEAAGHFPHLDEPERFVATLEDWIATTQPGRSDDSRFRAAFRRHAA